MLWLSLYDNHKYIFNFYIDDIDILANKLINALVIFCV